MTDDRVLIPGETCWRLERADDVAYIVDAADYFRHAKAAMLRARHRILLIGWDFDARTTFERGAKTLPGPNQLGVFLYWLLRQRPSLKIYLLRSNLRLLSWFDDIWSLTPVSLLNRISSKRMHFAVDGAHPTGAVHHQKVVVVDDSFAFCGGMDMTLDRWDTPQHRDHSRFRRSLGRAYGPRHDVTAAVDGSAARALAELCRNRWQAATDQSLDPLDVDADWPPGLEPVLHNVDVGIARTLPALEDQQEVREVEALNLAAIEAAHHTIYLENQYLAARNIVEALAARLRDPDGPEIVIVLPRRGNNRLEQEAMDSARHLLIQLLWEADEHSRLGVYWPVTDGGTPIYIHSKVLIIDDRLLRVGSSNFNNRSMGFDSECDIAIEAAAKASAREDIPQVIKSLRQQLVCEHLGVSKDEFEELTEHGQSFLEAVESLRGHGKSLEKFTKETVADEGGPLAESDLVDPGRVPQSLTRTVRRLITGISR